MYPPKRVYGADIETDNSRGFGLVPSQSRITQIALADESGVEVFEGDEMRLLVDFMLALHKRPPGVVAWWNGSVFDLPFIADRARERALPLGLKMSPDPDVPVKYDPLPGHQGGYVASWALPDGHSHANLDVQEAYRPYAEAHGIKHSLKPVMIAHGMTPIELDRTRLHEYAPEDVRAYVGSDAIGARALALRLLFPHAV